jgi:hypothetical protein
LTAGRSATAARTPFVVLVVTLLAGGLIALLLLNSAVNSDSFKLDKLQNDTTSYTDEQQKLQQEVDGYSAPGTLEKRARELGMVPGGDPAFLDPNGKVQGTPSPATAPPAPPPTTTPPPTTPPATPSGTPTGTTATPAGTTGTAGTADTTSTAGTAGTSGPSGTSTAATPTTPTPGR